MTQQVSRRRAALIFAVCFTAYTSIYIARLNLSMASPGLTGGDILTKAQIGLLGSAFSIIYAVGRLINGTLSDRVPPWFMMAAGLTLAGGANIAFSFLPPFFGMMLLWSLNAWAQSMLWSSVLCAVSAVYAPETAKRRTSLMVTSVAAGNILGIIVNTFIISRIGLGFAFLIPGGLTLVMAVICFAALLKLDVSGVQKQKTGSPAAGDESPEGIERDKIGRGNLTRVTPAAFLHGMVKDNISLWMAVYFTDCFAVDLEASAWFILFIPVAGFIGRLVYPAVYRICGEREHLVSFFGFCAVIIFALPLCLGIVTPLIAMLCLGMLYAAVSMVNTTILSIYPLQFKASGRIATVSGMMDFATYLGAGAASVLYGYIIEPFGYKPMFISWLAAGMISLILMLRPAFAARHTGIHNRKD